MNSGNDFDPRIENDYLEDEDLMEQGINKEMEKEGAMKKILKRADFPFFLLGGFILILLIFILVKLPGGSSKGNTDSMLSSSQVKELKKALDDIRSEIVELRFSIPEKGGSVNEDIVGALNSMEDRFEKKFSTLESKIDNIKSVKSAGVEKKQQSKKFSDKKPASVKKSDNLNQPESVKTFYHAVKKGDTLYRISRKYNVSVSNIKKWNNMKTNSIHPGEKLLIKN